MPSLKQIGSSLNRERKRGLSRLNRARKKLDKNVLRAVSDVNKFTGGVDFYGLYKNFKGSDAEFKKEMEKSELGQDQIADIRKRALERRNLRQGSTGRMSTMLASGDVEGVNRNRQVVKNALSIEELEQGPQKPKPKMDEEEKKPKKKVNNKKALASRVKSSVVSRIGGLL